MLAGQIRSSGCTETGRCTWTPVPDIKGDEHEAMASAVGGVTGHPSLRLLQSALTTLAVMAWPLRCGKERMVYTQAHEAASPSASWPKHTQLCRAITLRSGKGGGRLGQNPRPRAAPPAPGMKETSIAVEHSLLQGELLQMTVRVPRSFVLSPRRQGSAPPVTYRQTNTRASRQSTTSGHHSHLLVPLWRAWVRRLRI